MPGHLRNILQAEVLTWTGLYEVLVRPPVSEEAYARLCAELRPRVVGLLDLLDVEIEMLTNPLVRYYERWLAEYRERLR